MEAVSSGVEKMGRAGIVLNGMEAEAAALEEEDRRELEEPVPIIAPGSHQGGGY